MKTTRRRLLKFGIAAYLSNLAGMGAAQTMGGKKVIVVGAGIAGLAAGKQLHSQGAEVIVLEAGDYIGGRIRTDRSMGAPFEYGAGWIHGPSDENPIQKLALEVNAATFETDDDNLAVYDAQGLPLSDGAYDQLDKMYADLQSKFEKSVDRQDRRHLHQAMQDLSPDVLDDPLGRWMASAYFEFDIGADSKDISAANAFADGAFDGADVIFTEGYDSILTPLIDGLDIRLNTPVHSISCAEDSVDVDDMRADFVVCAVPLGVLKKGAITFKPDLPTELQAAVNEIGFGTITKIALKFDRPFWDLERQYFGIMTDPKGRWNYWLNYRTFSNENILLGLSFGSYAKVADQMNASEMTDDALDVLRSVWGDEVAAPRDVLTTHWSKDPNFRGAYSYPQKGGSIAQFDRFETPVCNRLFMAGEHTIFKYHGTTHGALLSGHRAAQAIIGR